MAFTFLGERKINCSTIASIKRYTDSLERNDSAYLEAKKLGFEIVGYEISSCEREFYDVRGNRIMEISNNQDTIIYVLQIGKNCCGTVRYHIEIKDSNTINFVTKIAPYSEMCFCGMCCFTAKFKLFNRSTLNPNKFEYNGIPIPFSENPIPEETSDTSYYPTGEIHTIKNCRYDQIELYREYDKKGKEIQSEMYTRQGQLFHFKKR